MDKYFNVVDIFIDCNKSSDAIKKEISDVLYHRKDINQEYINQEYINNTFADLDKRYKNKCPPPQVVAQVPTQVPVSSTRVPILIQPLPVITETDNKKKLYQDSIILKHLFESKNNQNIFIFICIFICTLINGISIWQCIEKQKNELSDYKKNIINGMIGLSISGIMLFLGIIITMVMCYKIVTNYVEIIFIFLLISTISNLILIFILISNTNSGLDSNSDSDSNYN
jgi:hypothetical protein